MAQCSRRKRARGGKETDQSIAQVVLVNLLGRRPDETIRGKVGPQPREGLPCQQNGAVGGLVEIRPEERRLVSGDLGRSHEPLGNLIEVEPGDRRVSVRRDEVDMWHLFFFQLC